MKKLMLALSLVTLTLGACSSVERRTASDKKEEGYKSSSIDRHRAL